jgi:hypothetical protein
VLTRDLPQPTAGAAPASAPASAQAPAPAGARYSAVFSRVVRRGPWELAQRSSFRSIFGTIALDLRQVRLAGPDVELEIYNLFGTVTVIVPEGIAVSVEGGGLFASQVIDAPSVAAVAGGPVLRIRCTGPGGTLYVRTRDPAPKSMWRLLGKGGG